MGIVTFLTVRFVEIAVVLLLILFMPSIPPKGNFTYFKVTPAKQLEGNLALNNRLNGVEHLHENELKGAEAFAEYNGELYSSLFTGEVVKFSKGHIVPIAKFGKPCVGYTEESICGRPLGLKFDKNGVLYVADAYMGVWKVDVKNGQKTLLISMDTEIEGKKPLVPNSLTISENGDIYWTDSSTEFKLEDGIFSLLTDGSGRLIHYNAQTKTNKVLMDGIHFANGVMLSPGEEFLVVSETALSRLYRFYLKGPKKGTHDVFVDGLPGLPDNVNSDGKDGFLVPLIVARDSNHPVVSQIIGPFPMLRKLAARILGLTEIGFRTLDRIYPNFYTQTIVHWIGHFESIQFILPERVTILHLSKNGEIIDSLHSTDKSVAGISDAFIFGEHLYLGSPYNHYIGRVTLSKAGLDHLRKKREAPVKQAQTPPSTAAPTKQTPSPTPAPTRAPIKQTPPLTAAPVKQTPPPTAAPVKQAPPPVKQTPPSTAAPVKQAPPPPAAPKQATTPPTQNKPAPTPVPAKQNSPPVKQVPPIKQAPPPTAVPVKTTAPTAAPVKQSPPPTAAPVKQAPPPVQQAPPTKQAPPPPAASPTKQTSNSQKNKEAEAPKVVPVKENSVPKSESIKPRK